MTIADQRECRVSDNAQNLDMVRRALAEGWTFEKLCWSLAGDRVWFPRSMRGTRAEMIKRMAGQGMTAKQIADKVGCKVRNVQKVLRAHFMATQVRMSSDTVVADHSAGVKAGV